MRKTRWDDASVETLTKLWKSGKTSTFIAGELSKDGISFTRNMVVGKVNRLSLARSTKAARVARPVSGATVKRRRVIGSKPSFTISSRPKAPKAPRTRPHHVEDEVRVPNPKHRVALLNTRDYHCRAIVDYEKGLKDKAICCGEVTPWIVSSGMKRRSSWCNYHRKLYLSPPKRQ